MGIQPIGINHRAANLAITYYHIKYICIEEEGGMETETAKRVGAGWVNWKKRSGVLCDKRMPVKLKGKVIWS